MVKNIIENLTKGISNYKEINKVGLSSYSLYININPYALYKLILV